MQEHKSKNKQLAYLLRFDFADKDFFLAHKGKIKCVFYSMLLWYVGSRIADLRGSSQCILDMPSEASKIFREPENCDFCKDVNQVEKVTDITPLNFQESFAGIAKPVVVSDGAVHWPALKKFSFGFFKKLHKKVSVDRSQNKNCQFFPYKTEFRNLEDVFNMSEARANLMPNEKPWYVGWSNCNDEAGKILRKYYIKPYFLGNNSENIALSWIFMGGPGNGAQMHVDNVHYPSWQAQLKGRKLWKLVPPPECYNTCGQMEVIVEPGEIIAVDTNRWYHQTLVVPGEISITIGSEFD